VRTAGGSITKPVLAALTGASRVSRQFWWPVPTTFPNAPKTAGIRVEKQKNNPLYQPFQREPL